MNTDRESQLGRWSRRKAEARTRRGSAAPELHEESADLPTVTKADEPERESTKDDAPSPDLPDVESLGAESDFSAFMKEGVPKALRRQALRKLWLSDPAFNIIDEMVEYGEDYNVTMGPVEGLKSAWEVGKGYPKEEREETVPEKDDAVAQAEESDDETGREVDGDGRAQTGEDSEDDSVDGPDEEDNELG